MLLHKYKIKVSYSVVKNEACSYYAFELCCMFVLGKFRSIRPDPIVIIVNSYGKIDIMGSMAGQLNSRYSVILLVNFRNEPFEGAIN